MRWLVVQKLSAQKPIWIARDYIKCSGCRRCEVACSYFHEKKIWPEASRIRVFMLVPGIEVPHFCSQCHDHPCIDACPTKALSMSEKTGAILVDKKLCDACGDCIDACPGRIPRIHPTEKYALICDLCEGAPQCVRVCQQGKWNALWVIPREDDHYISRRLYARKPEDVTKELVILVYGEAGEGMI